jgi:hypothetical protein
MTSFLSAASYSPVLTLFVGLLTFAGCMGLGAVVLRILRLNVPTPFVQIVSVLLGIEITSMAVQLLAIAQLASSEYLILLWGVSVAFVPGTYLVIPRRDKVAFPTRSWPVLAVVLVAAAVNLVAALAPSSKIDELYYHMLLPSRIVADGGLRFYRMPIESAILPHMIYQVFATPLHALRVPDAANVVSWVLSIMLVWLGWMLLQARQVTCTLAYGSVAAVLVGMYPVVNYVTGGAHAFGDLALATAVVAVGTSRQLLETTTPTAFAAVVSLSCCAAASSKLSLWPISLALSLLATIMLGEQLLIGAKNYGCLPQWSCRGSSSYYHLHSGHSHTAARLLDRFSLVILAKPRMTQRQYKSSSGTPQGFTTRCANLGSNI